jgi:hypothetical protein
MDARFGLAVALLFVFLVLTVCVSPFFTIWSLNCLFGTEIPINFKTWCSVVWLMIVLHGIRINYKSSS